MLPENWLLIIIENLDAPTEIKYCLHEIMQSFLEHRDNLLLREKKIVHKVRENIRQSIERRFGKNIDIISEPPGFGIVGSNLDQLLKKRPKLPYKFYELRVVNYRQFAGEQIIQFSQDLEKSITVIRGENGAGKTNLLNAISWCLFGNELLRHSNTKPGPQLSSQVGQALKQDQTAEMRVELILGRHEAEVRIIRKVLFTRSSGGNLIPVPDSEQFSVYVFEGSAIGWKESKAPTIIINKIIPKKFVEFFFFDGERITKFFQVGGEQDIADAIHTVSDLKILSFVIDTIRSLERSERQKIARNRPDTVFLSEKMEKQETEMDRHKLLIQSAKEELTTIENELAQIEHQLSASNADKILVVRKEQELHEENLTDLKKRLNRVQTKANEELITLLPYALMHPHYQQLQDYIRKTGSQEISSLDYHPSLLEKILSKGICICGTPLDQTNREVLLALNKHRSSTSEENLIQNFQRLLDAYYGHQIGRNYFRYQQLRKEAGELEENIEDKLVRLEELKSSLEQSDDLEISTLGRQHKEVKTKRDRLILKLGEIEGIYKQLNMEFNRTQKEVDKALEKDKEFATQEWILKVFDYLQGVLEAMYEQLTEYIRNKIQQLTTDYFVQLTWKKEAFSHIEIDPNYKIKLLNPTGIDRFAELSAGERQILAYAFIAALTSISGFDVPMIIDTPLGRISVLPRRNIASCFPNYLKGTQITFLFTDTEFTNEVRSRMKDRIGYEYFLNYDQKTERCQIEGVLNE